MKKASGEKAVVLLKAALLLLYKQAAFHLCAAKTKTSTHFP